METSVKSWASGFRSAQLPGDFSQEHTRAVTRVLSLLPSALAVVWPGEGAGRGEQHSPFGVAVLHRSADSSHGQHRL